MKMRKVWLGFALTGALVAALAASSAFGQDVAKGKQVYDQSCAACHGPGGSGGFAPTLKKTFTADAITNKVRQGGGGMPAFSAAQISDAQLADLVAYVQSLAPSAVSSPTAAATAATTTAATATATAAAPPTAAATAAAPAQVPRTGEASTSGGAGIGLALSILLVGSGLLLKRRTLRKS